MVRGQRTTLLEVRLREGLGLTFPFLLQGFVEPPAKYVLCRFRATQQSLASRSL